MRESVDLSQSRRADVEDYEPSREPKKLILLFLVATVLAVALAIVLVSPVMGFLGLQTLNG